MSWIQSNKVSRIKSNTVSWIRSNTQIMSNMAISAELLMPMTASASDTWRNNGWSLDTAVEFSWWSFHWWTIGVDIGVGVAYIRPYDIRIPFNGSEKDIHGPSGLVDILSYRLYICNIPLHVYMYIRSCYNLWKMVAAYKILHSKSPFSWKKETRKKLVKINHKYGNKHNNFHKYHDIATSGTIK